MIEEIRTEKIMKSVFNGAEWIADMNSSQLLDRMKDISFPSRTKGNHNQVIETTIVERKGIDNEWYDYELRTPIGKITEGTDMSNYRPIIDDHEYTWGELKRFPKELLQVKLYRYWLVQQKYGEQE